LLTAFSSFAQKQTRTFLLTKEEYKFLESKNKIIPAAIKYVFGENTKQNQYKIEIKQIEAYNSEVAEFKYNMEAIADPKRDAVRAGIVGAKENIDLHFKITYDKNTSVLNESIKPYLSDKNTFTLNIVVIGDPRTFIKETRDKEDFFQILDLKLFADKAFHTFFGEPKKMNYKIVYDKLSACFVKDILEPQCNEKLELIGPDNKYNDFSNKITSAEYQGKWVMFNVGIERTASILIEPIEKAIFKMKSGNEYVKFYFVIPMDNLRARKVTVEGKIVNEDRKPVANITVFLRDVSNQVIASQTTDSKGSYTFEKLSEGQNYNIYIDNNVKEKALFVTTNNDVVIAELKKTDLGFEYKLLPADISRLAGLEEVDATMDFMRSVKGKMVKVTDKISPLANQTVEIKDNSNKVLQTQKTDGQGNFEFKNINPNEAHVFDLPGYVASDKDEKIYMTNAAGDFITEFKKDQNNIFAYKILPSEVSRLRYMNEEDIEMEFKGQISNVSNQINIRELIYYEVGSAKLMNESMPILDKVAKILTNNPGYKLEIISHTDSRGEDANNQDLSLKRSEAASNYLVAKKIDKARLKTLGMGESTPLNNCLDGRPCMEEEYKMNRRTEFKFYKEFKHPQIN
jgi:outer membrane protein OmpA-like peptidoglycan-associated protein